MNLRFRNSKKVDLTQPFSGYLMGGIRGFADAMALECYSNEISVCLKTFQDFTVIVEMMELTNNKRLNAAIERELQFDREGQVWLDCYMDRKSFTEFSPTLTTRRILDNNNFIMERMEIQDPQVLRSQRTEEAKALRRMGVDTRKNNEMAPRQDGISNTLTGVVTDNLLSIPVNADPDNVSRTIKATAQQVSIANLTRDDSFGATGVIDLLPINTDAEGCASTLTTVNHNAKHITDPKGGHRENGIVYLIQTEDGRWIAFRIRKLTERECFRLMDVSDADIDLIQASGISRTRQYKMAGNSIVVNCLFLIFKNLFYPEQTTQTTLF